ncbi:hypothetical protein LOZ61_002192 [Ophidiomyces ophidiicola]|nr:hypothetical protein LOZ61_002192 [Ophidiomyces ophidiicola]KAI1923225.1 hypothetical protein LOZ60_005302 [Ophidiomyces ophidiicola]KAI2026903.1 hypothetical protein LOZ48_004896 [Ophidiomyces ophidiicola]KAI2095550.1 hypothetical protein LOZ33_004099 [Ophidiomyces ophidiicola]KAI2127077.1 hypothetical protein LOZ31_002939 [Ophidiomyces ophidiicola]
MPRTLPWQTNTKSRKSTTPVPPSHAQSRASTDFANHSVKRDRISYRRSRTPSTSPAREPPPEEYMREGLHNDDMYMMVEDEFLATAQTYTRHLHFAEYARRKKQAKLANQSKLSSITRPTNTKIGLNTGTKRRLQVQDAAARHKAALDDLSRAAGRPPVDSEVEDIDESGEDRDDDPWVGTQLHPLMAIQRQPKSLMGLHAIKSSSKAALGRSTSFGRKNNSSTAKPAACSSNNKQQAAGRIKREGSLAIGFGATRLPSVSIQASAAMKPPTKNSSRLPAVPTNLTENSLPQVAETRKDSAYHRAKAGSSTCNTIPKSAPATSKGSAKSQIPAKRSKLSLFFDDLDDLDTEIKVEGGIDEPMPKKRPAPRAPVEHRKLQDEQRKKQRLSEVPTFL